MTRRILIVIVLLVTTNMSYADNSFVYLRYDESTNNVFAIQQKIRDLLKKSVDFLLFYDHKKYQGESLIQLLESKDFMTSLSVYEPYKEAEELSLLMDKLLKSTVIQDDAKMNLNSPIGSQWKMYFIVPEGAGRKELIKWLDVNGFFSKNINLIFIIYDIDTNLTELSLSEYMESIEDLILLNF